MQQKSTKVKKKKSQIKLHTSKNLFKDIQLFRMIQVIKIFTIF